MQRFGSLCNIAQPRYHYEIPHLLQIHKYSSIHTF